MRRDQCFKAFLILLSLNLFVVIEVTAARDDQVTLDLRAWVVRTHFLTSSAQSVMGTLVIDNAEKATLIFGSASKTLAIDIINPGGQHFSIGSPDTSEVLSRLFPDPNDQQSTGSNYMFVLSNPQPGTWSYEIQETIPLTTPRAVLFSFTSSSPIRAGMLGGGQDYLLTRDVRLAVVTVEGENVLKNLSINASLTKPADPGFITSPVIFRDDGLNGDEAASDGLFTASFRPGVLGEFQVVAAIDGINAQGNSFQRSTSALFRVHPVRASFLGFFTDRSIDTDGDGMFDQIGVSPDIDVVEGGRYNVVVTLEASNGSILTSNTIVNFTPGTTNTEVVFTTKDIKDILTVNGPYTFKEARLELLNVNPPATTDIAFDLGVTAGYQLGQFDRAAIEFIGGSSATGVDTNSNGKFDFLDVSLPVDFLFSDFYSWSARLVDVNGTEIALAASSGSFSSGATNLLLKFNGSAIGTNGVDGPYFVRNLIIFGGGESLIVDDALTTSSFLASNFEGFILDQEPPTLNVSASPSLLWPPNHKLVEITVSIQVSDNIDPNPIVRLESITSDEDQNAIGDGNTSTDIEIDPAGRIFLRAERSGLGDGRVYTLTYSAQDSAGNATHATTTVTVPHDERPK